MSEQLSSMQQLIKRVRVGKQLVDLLFSRNGVVVSVGSAHNPVEEENWDKTIVSVTFDSIARATDCFEGACVARSPSAVVKQYALGKVKRKKSETKRVEPGWNVNTFEQRRGGDMEISIVHSSFPHGEISWGWDGLHKIVLPTKELSEHYSENKHQWKSVISELQAVAQGFADVLNSDWRTGIVIYEGDE